MSSVRIDLKIDEPKYMRVIKHIQPKLASMKALAQKQRTQRLFLSPNRYTLKKTGDWTCECEPVSISTDCIYGESVTRDGIELLDCVVLVHQCSFHRIANTCLPSLLQIARSVASPSCQLTRTHTPSPSRCRARSLNLSAARGVLLLTNGFWIYVRARVLRLSTRKNHMLFQHVRSVVSIHSWIFTVVSAIWCFAF